MSFCAKTARDSGQCRPLLRATSTQLSYAQSWKLRVYLPDFVDVGRRIVQEVAEVERRCLQASEASIFPIRERLKLCLFMAPAHPRAGGLGLMNY